MHIVNGSVRSPNNTSVLASSVASVKTSGSFKTCLRSSYSVTILSGCQCYSLSHVTRYTNDSIRLTEVDFIRVLSIGARFLYLIPGFDVLGVELQHIQVKGFSKIENPENVFDIIKNDLSLNTLAISFAHGA